MAVFKKMKARHSRLSEPRLKNFALELRHNLIKVQAIRTTYVRLIDRREG
jgi:hypothetical protein